MRALIRVTLVAIFFSLTISTPAAAKRILPERSRRPTLLKRNIRMQRITVQTSDGVTIVGDWTAPTPRLETSGVGAPTPKGVGVALLLHMMPADRKSWRGLSQKLSEQGMASLAIDLRGHGESVSSSRAKSRDLDYRTFSDAQHQASRLDVDAALAWLKSKGYDASRVVVIGASIGANLAIDAAAHYPEIKKVVMLSGGLDFRGVATELSARKLSVNSRVFLVASADDDYSLQSHRTLAKLLGVRATIKEFKTAGHGTTMFGHEPKLLDDIVQWIMK